jgi:hypothetical protein
VARLRRVLSDKNSPNDLQEVMNAIRLLTRVLPVAFEGSVNDGFEETLFWKNTIPGQPSDVSIPVPSCTCEISFSRLARIHFVVFTIPSRFLAVLIS